MIDEEYPSGECSLAGAWVNKKLDRHEPDNYLERRTEKQQTRLRKRQPPGNRSNKIKPAQQA
ncbi:MAG TPA: hypothetical protein DG414_03745 [Gammaproteobacteria bacterium]|nr:hypothetical protein [Arenicellales bacterium]HCY12933.1 hypothetical protein [Gammaproteobacteria bacterium]